MKQVELDCIIDYVENDLSEVKAYENHFETGDLPPNGVKIKAKKFFSRDDVQKKIAELEELTERQRTYRVSVFEQSRQLEEAAKRIAISKEWVLQQHVETLLMAKQAIPVTDKDGNNIGIYTADYNAVRGALVEIAKIEGYNADKKVDVNVNFNQKTDKELLEEIKQIEQEKAKLRELVKKGEIVVDAEIIELLEYEPSNQQAD